jgi:hypothetical protein
MCTVNAPQEHADPAESLVQGRAMRHGSQPAPGLDHSKTSADTTHEACHSQILKQTLGTVNKENFTSVNIHKAAKVSVMLIQMKKLL